MGFLFLEGVIISVRSYLFDRPRDGAGRLLEGIIIDEIRDFFASIYKTEKKIGSNTPLNNGHWSHFINSDQFDHLLSHPVVLISKSSATLLLPLLLLALALHFGAFAVLALAGWAFVWIRKIFFLLFHILSNKAPSKIKPFPEAGLILERTRYV